MSKNKIKLQTENPNEKGYVEWRYYQGMPVGNLNTLLEKINEGGGGSGGVSKAYVDTQDATVLETSTERLEQGKQVLEKEISDLSKTTTQSITQLSNDLIDEKTTRETAVSTLSSALSTETSNRQSADTALENKISEKSKVVASTTKTTGAATAKSIKIDNVDYNLPEGGSGGEQPTVEIITTSSQLSGELTVEEMGTLEYNNCIVVVHFTDTDEVINFKKDDTTHSGTVWTYYFTSTNSVDSIRKFVAKSDTSNWTITTNTLTNVAKTNVENTFTKNQIFDKQIYVTDDINTYGDIFTHQGIQANGIPQEDEYNQYFSFQYEYPGRKAAAFHDVFMSADYIKFHNVGRAKYIYLPVNKDGTIAFTSDIPSITTTLNKIYPVGAVYISVNSSLPNYFPGTWEKISDGFFLEATTGNAGVEKEAGLPNIKGSAWSIMTDDGSSETSTSGSFAFTTGKRERSFDGAGGSSLKTLDFNAANSSAIYKDDCTTVQPKSLTVSMWKRVS